MSRNLLATAFCLASAPTLTARNLEIAVTNQRNLAGQICLSVFDDSSAFPSQADGALVAICQPVGENFQVDLEEGDYYAIAVFHDENLNNDLDRIGPFQIPSEGFGFSNNPRLGIGLPKYEAVEFLFTEQTGMEITLNYLL